jgi:hypothetical protein
MDLFHPGNRIGKAYWYCDLCRKYYCFIDGRLVEVKEINTDNMILIQRGGQ